MFSSEQWLANSGGADFYNGVATQSVRFPIGEAHLQRTPGTSGNQKRWTSSFWIKRTSLGSAYLWSGASYSGNDGIAAIYFSTDDSIHTYYDTSGANPVGKVGGGLYRDLTAWYHICWAVDAANTVHKIWVNGVLISTDTGKYPVDFDYGMNRATSLNKFGEAAWGNSTQFEGYLADFVHLDGQYLEYDSFAEFKNGVLIPIDTSGLTYGTNGFRLEFKETAVGTGDTDTIGADTANSNHLDSAVIAADDCNMPDSPENNFATGLGELSEATNDQGYIAATWSEGNLKMTPSSAAWNNGMSNFGMTSGKWYAEAKVVNIGPNGGYTRFGMRASPTRTYDEYFWAANGNGQIDAATSPYSDRVGTYANGNVLQIALDLDNNALYFGKNGTWENSATTSEIAAGTVTNAFASGTTLIPTGDGFTYFFYFNMHGHGTAPIHIWNFGQDPSFAGEITAGTETPSEGAGVFLYAPPSGFLALASKNIQETTIGANSLTQSTDHFGILTYTGDGAQTRTITSGDVNNGIGGQVDFKPDWVVQKIRSGTTQGAGNWDSTRGFAGANALDWSDSTAEGTWVGASSAGYGFVSGVDTNDVSLNDGTSSTNGGFVNYNGRTYVLWNWKAGGEPTATNSAGAGNTPTAGSVKIDGVNLGSALAGSIPATKLSANTTSGFSIVTYSGNADASATIGHGLTNLTPKMIMIKQRNTTGEWIIYTETLGKDNKLNFTTGGSATSALFNNVAPTPTVFSVKATSTEDTFGNGATYVAYCFADVEGYSKFGSYTGNNSTDGNFIFLNFSPALVIIKYVSGTAGGTKNWHMYDNKRSAFNPTENVLFANEATVESGASAFDIDFLSNGFKLRNAEGAVNNGAEYIYMCWAETPFKYATAK